MSRSIAVVCPWILVATACGLPESAPLATNGTGDRAVPQSEATVDIPEPDRFEPARRAVEQATPFLQTEGDAWMAGTTRAQSGDGCVSCHQVPFGLWALREADRVGLVSAEQRRAIEELAERAIEFATPESTGRVMSWGPLILADLGGRGDRAPTAEWLAIGDSIVGRQRDEGYWRARGQFPAQRRELDETNAVATLWTLLALAQLEPLDDLQAASRGRALGWIEGQPEGTSNEWLMTRLLVEGGPEGRTAALARLRERQSADGGWGWAPGEPSNAYSTGQALYTLARAGVDTVDPAVVAGVNYLVGSQGDDGFWQVPSRLISDEPADPNDYVYDYWGTAWAVIGLARALDPGSPRGSQLAQGHLDQRALLHLVGGR